MIAKRQSSLADAGKHPADLAAFEVAYALMRVAKYSNNLPLASRLQEAGFALVWAVAERDEARFTICLQALESYLRLGEEIGAVHPANTPLILNRARNILPLLRQREDEGPLKVDLWPEASQVAQPSSSVKSSPTKAATKKTVVSRTPKDEQPNKEKVVAAPATKESTDSITLQRQAAIAELIRQKVNCRMKDIQEEMPDVSERTLRYDISALIERGEIERVGAGGPFSYYRAKEQTVGNLPGVTESKGAFILPL